eukprot:8352538-Pyramimonas_sp.AAC.1
MSSLMEWNYSHMDLKKAKSHLSAGLNHLRFAGRVLAERHASGRYFLFEHPRTCRSFQEPEVQALASLEG